MLWLRKWKWSLQLCFFDPTLSECLGTLPVPRRRLVGATRYQVFLPVAPTDDLIRSVGPNFLVQRTKLLTPSVDHLPVFKVAWTTTTDTQFARTIQCRQPKCSRDLARVLSQFIRRSLNGHEFHELSSCVPCAEPISARPALEQRPGRSVRFGAVTTTSSSCFQAIRIQKPCQSWIWQDC